jgi:predicted Fe-S protein YdhL (DUF1289 family)
MPAPRAIATPCVKVCFIDPDSGLCLGCHRTVDEVALWTRYSDAERAEIIAGLPARRAAIDPRKLGAN